MLRHKVEKEYIGNELSNKKYNEMCKAKLPKSIRVIHRSKITKLIKTALKPGSTVTNNSQLIKETEVLDVNKLNSDVLCCVSHRWCTTKLKVSDYIREILDLLNYGIYGNDQCNEDLQFSESILNYYNVIRKIVVQIFNGSIDIATDFLNFISSRMTVRGMSTTVRPPNIDLSYPFKSYQESLANFIKKPELLIANPNEEPIFDTISRILMFEFSTKMGYLGKLTHSHVNQFQPPIVSIKNSENSEILSKIKHSFTSFLLQRKVSDQENILARRMYSIFACLEKFKFLTTSQGFNDYDPITLVILYLLLNSKFEYFWVDFICSPQGDDIDMRTTMQSVKAGMCVFSLATVIIAPPLDIEKWKSLKQKSLYELSESCALNTFEEFALKLPLLSFGDRLLFISSQEYFLRMWTLHEMAIAPKLFFWWQYFFGPFDHVNPDTEELMLKVEKIAVKSVKTALYSNPEVFASNRGSVTSTLTESGPGHAVFTWACNVNFAAMQTRFSNDWEQLARSIFNISSESSLNDAILNMKFLQFTFFLIQYSGLGYVNSLIGLIDPYLVNHTFKYDTTGRKDLTGAFDSEDVTLDNIFKLEDRVAYLNDKAILTNCDLYKTSSDVIRTFALMHASTVINAMGLHRDAFFEELSNDFSGFMLLGSWKLLPKILNEKKIFMNEVLKPRLKTVVSQNNTMLMSSLNSMMEFYESDSHDVLVIFARNCIVTFGMPPFQKIAIGQYIEFQHADKIQYISLEVP